MSHKEANNKLVADITIILQADITNP
jgi:hypothetical protein